jgi:hypothetical protein
MVTSCWMALLQWHRPWWLIGFKKPLTIILCIPPICAFLIICSKKLKTTGQRTLFLATMMLFFCGTLKIQELGQPTQHTVITCDDSTFNVIYDNQNVILIDAGDLAKKPGNQSWLEYSLIPELTKKTGKVYFTSLIALQFNQRTLEYAQILNSIYPLQAVYLPAYEGKISWPAYKAFTNLKEALKKTGGTMIRLGTGNPKTRINFDVHNKILITASTTKVAYHDATYLLLGVRGTINNQTLTVDAHKLNHLKKKE